MEHFGQQLPVPTSSRYVLLSAHTNSLIRTTLNTGRKCLPWSTPPEYPDKRCSTAVVLTGVGGCFKSCFLVRTGGLALGG